MLIFSPQNLAFIAVPKTGTTAVEMALKSRADIIFTKRRKHITAQRFHSRLAPFLKAEFDLDPERFAVIRDPEEQIRSWYRYRARDKTSGSAFSTGNISFDRFVREVISDDPPPHAKIGSQLGMLTSPQGELLVHHLFAHEMPMQLLDFLDTRFQDTISLKNKNVSPPVPAELEPATLKLLKTARTAEFDLHARVIDANGHLVSAML